jgi:amidohydrolase
MKKIRVLGLLLGICFCLILGAGAFGAEKLQVIPPETEQMTGLRKAMDAKVDSMSARMIEMTDWMYQNPESGFLEFKASEMLTQELKKYGFSVEMNVPNLPANIDKMKIIGGLTKDYKGPAGLPTAFKAKYKGKSESPVIAFLVEYDALRGNPPFHGCQHNIQGPAGVGAAVALANVMEENQIPGSVWVVGTPAEEVGPPSKALMADAGYFNGIDFIIRNHGTYNWTEREAGGFACCCGSIRQLKYTFTGKSAHASRPWQGASALDAVLQTFTGMNMLRQLSEPQFRFMGVVSDGGVAPNIIPEMASATLWIRYFIDDIPSALTPRVSPKRAQEMIDAKVEQLNNIARGAAQATGTKVEIDLYGKYVPGISVGALNDVGFQYAIEYGGIDVRPKAIPPDAGGWDETGMASKLVPGLQVKIGTEGGCTEKTPGHSTENANITITEQGHKGLILIGKVMSATGLRLVLDPAIRQKVNAEFEMWKKKYNE